MAELREEAWAQLKSELSAEDYAALLSGGSLKAKDEANRAEYQWCLCLGLTYAGPTLSDDVRAEVETEVAALRLGKTEDELVVTADATLIAQVTTGEHLGRAVHANYFWHDYYWYGERLWFVSTGKHDGPVTGPSVCRADVKEVVRSLLKSLPEPK